MKARTIVALAVLCLAAATMSLAQNAFLGTWKLNEAKSKLPAGATKNSTVKYEASGDQITVTIDGVDGSGNPLHSVWTGKLDGKDYAVTGDPTSDMRAVTKVNDHAMSFSAKKGGKVVLTGRIVVAPDGKSRTVTSNGTDASGKKTTATTVYDKQM